MVLVNQVRQRPPPAIQPPDQDAIDLSPAGRRNERLPLGARRSPGSDVLNLDGDDPIPLLCIVPHRGQLHGQHLLVVGGNTGVEPDAKRICPCYNPPLESGGGSLCVFSGLDMSIQPVQKLYFIYREVCATPLLPLPAPIAVILSNSGAALLTPDFLFENAAATFC